MPDPSRRSGRQEAAIVLAPLALCPLVALLAPGNATEATARAVAIARWEHDLGLFVEPSVHGWALDRPLLMAVASALYLGLHMTVLVGALVVAWHRAPARYRLARDTFIVAQVLTIAGYLLWPTAPPRLVAGLGLTDTLSATVGAGSAGLTELLQYRYAAMPSGHVVFALVAAATLATTAESRRVRIAAAGYPALVVVLVLVTANHFWLDAAAGVLVAVLATAIVVAREVLGSAPRQPPRQSPLQSEGSRSRSSASSSSLDGPVSSSSGPSVGARRWRVPMGAMSE